MIILTHEADLALKYALELSGPRLEVGGFGRTQLSESGLDIIVNDIYIPPQIVQAGHTDIKGPAEEGGEGMLEAAWRYFADRNESWADWRLWWHVHPKGVNRPSGTDVDTLRGQAKLFESWALGMVIEKGGERYAWAGIFQPPFNVVLNELEIGVFQEERADIRTRIEGMFEHVKEKVWQPQGNSGGARGTTGGNSNASPVTHLPRKSGKRILDYSNEEFELFLKGQPVGSA